MNTVALNKSYYYKFQSLLASQRIRRKILKSYPERNMSLTKQKEIDLIAVLKSIKQRIKKGTY